MQIKDIPGTHQARTTVTGESTANAAKSFPLLAAPDDVTVTAIRWIPGAAVTGHDTNYFSLAVQNKGAAGAGSTAVTATKAYTAGVDSVAFDAEALTLSGTAANLQLAAGDVLALVRTVAASGLAMPEGVIEVDYRHGHA